MNKDLSISILFDFYGELLTEKQKLSLDMYHNMDYSLAEIAEHIGVTRQCVRDFIKKGERRLSDFEEKLGMAKKFRDITGKLEEINSKSKDKNILRITDEIIGIMEL